MLLRAPALLSRTHNYMHTHTYNYNIFFQMIQILLSFRWRSLNCLYHEILRGGRLIEIKTVCLLLKRKYCRLGKHELYCLKVHGNFRVSVLKNIVRFG